MSGDPTSWSRRDFLKRVGTAASFAVSLSPLGLLEACANASTGTGPGPASPVKGGHLIEGAASDVTSFNTVVAPGNVNNIPVSSLLFDGLLNSRANGELVPAIAKDMPAVSADGLTYTFKLRQDVRWTDGQPLTSDDVLFTYNLMLDPAYRDVPSPRRSEVENYVESIANPDPYTVVIKTKKVYAPFLVSHGQYGIMPKHVLGGMTGKQIATADFNTAPTVTNGVFKFSKWEKGSNLTLLRNDGYYGQKAYLDAYIRSVVADSATVVERLQTGELDIASIQASALDAARGAGLTTHAFENLSVQWFAYNLDPTTPAGKIFSDKRVRQALVYALDRQKIADVAFFKQATVLQSWELPHSWAYATDVKPTYSFDKARAEQLLAAAGWQMGAGGVRVKDGQPLRLTWIVYSVEPYKSIAQIVQQMWKEVGVQLDLKAVALSAALQIFEFTHAFDVANLAINLLPDPDLSTFFSSRNASAGGLNGMAFKNATADSLLDQGLSTLDVAKRKEIYGKLQNLLADEMPACPLLNPKTIVAMTSRVRGAELEYKGLGMPQHPWAKTAWVTDGK